MFNRIFKREKPKVYLGTIAVVPRNDFKRHFEHNIYTGENLEVSLQNRLHEIFNFPLSSERANPSKTDLAVDVVIAKFQAGNTLNVHAGDFGIPIFWRPKIELASKLYNLNTGETKLITTITTKLSWRNYLSRLFTWRALIGFRPMFDAQDMEKLLTEACLQLLPKLIGAV